MFSGTYSKEVLETSKLIRSGYAGMNQVVSGGRAAGGWHPTLAPLDSCRRPWACAPPFEAFRPQHTSHPLRNSAVLSLALLPQRKKALNLRPYDFMDFRLRGDGNTYLANVRLDQLTGGDEEVWQTTLKTRHVAAGSGGGAGERPGSRGWGTGTGCAVRPPVLAALAVLLRGGAMR